MNILTHDTFERPLHYVCVLEILVDWIFFSPFYCFLVWSLSEEIDSSDSFLIIVREKLLTGQIIDVDFCADLSALRSPDSSTF